MPKRIQRKRTAGWRKPDNCVIVCRPTRYGNPYKINERIEDDGVPSGYTILDGPTVLELFRNHCEMQLMDDPKWLEPLRGKDLACWCRVFDEKGHRVPCHADILLELANVEAK
jgi:hypothetical protein